MTAASVQPALPHRTVPKVGICESTGPAVIAWVDGTRTEYTLTGTGSTSVIYKLVPPTDPSFLGLVIRAVGFPDAGARGQGLVISQYKLQDAAGTDIFEVLVVKMAIGIQMIPLQYAIPLPAA